MEPFEINGSDGVTALRFIPSETKLTLAVRSLTTPEHRSVVLQPAWLRPLGAWLAGESVPASFGDTAQPFDARYSPLLSVVSDEAAVAWGTHAWARLLCSQPFGPAHVLVGPRGRREGLTVALTPGARQVAATYLRRVDASAWARPRTAA